MTKEKAKDLLDNLIGFVEDNHGSDYDEALKIAIKALEEKPCEDCISRQAIIEVLSIYPFEKVVDCLSIIEEFPSVTPIRRTRQWVFVDKAKEHARCSECYYGDVDLVGGRPWNYCPNCGAKMAESEEK